MAKLTDFGFGRFGVESTSGLWSFGVPAGSPGYVAPEVILQRNYDYSAYEEKGENGRVEEGFLWGVCWFLEGLTILCVSRNFGKVLKIDEFLHCLQLESSGADLYSLGVLTWVLLSGGLVNVEPPQPPTGQRRTMNDFRAHAQDCDLLLRCLDPQPLSNSLL